MSSALPDRRSARARSERPVRVDGCGRPGGRRVARADGLVVGWGGGSGGASPSVQVAEMQRTRLLAATVGVLGELSYGDVTVALITSRARMSRRTFYELFENLEDCLVACLEGALERITSEVAIAVADESSWRERVRRGLWSILSLFDREPLLARACIVQAARGSDMVLERRAEVFAGLARAIDGGRDAGARGVEAPPLTADGLVGASYSIVHEHLLKRREEPLTSLFGSLMSLIVLPYLGPAVARREQVGPTPVTASDTSEAMRLETPDDLDLLRGVSMRLTYRTARVLAAIAEHPGISNRRVGEHAEVTDQGQISKLLARLEGLGLLANTGQGHEKGAPNAWKLTTLGERITHNINTPNREHTTDAGERED